MESYHLVIEHLTILSLFDPHICSFLRRKIYRKMQEEERYHTRYLVATIYSTVVTSTRYDTQTAADAISTQYPASDKSHHNDDESRQ